MIIEEARLIADLLEVKKMLSKANLKIPYWMIPAEDLEGLRSHISLADGIIDNILEQGTIEWKQK